MQDAVIRNVEAIGEAAKRVSAESRGACRHSIGRASAACETYWYTTTFVGIRTTSGTSPPPDTRTASLAGRELRTELNAFDFPLSATAIRPAPKSRPTPPHRLRSRRPDFFPPERTR